MIRDTSGMFKKTKAFFFFFKSPRSNSCKMKIRVNSWVWHVKMMSCSYLILEVTYFRLGVRHMYMISCSDLILVVAYSKLRLDICR